MARDLNLAFSVIQRVALGVNSQMAIIPIRHFVLSTTLRRPWALTHILTFRPPLPLPKFRHYGMARPLSSIGYDADL